MSSLAPLLQAFFTDRLMTQRRASPHTIAAYRDAFRLLLDYVTVQTGTTPSALQISDLDAPCISGFLTHLHHVRGNSVRTRNARLAAIHSLFGYAALRHPEHAAVIQRVLAIPTARIERNLVTYLDHAEADALLAVCDQTTRTGRRDHAMFALAIQTGLRISELTGLTIADVHLGNGPHVHCIGKGRKERVVPIGERALAWLIRYLDEVRPRLVLDNAEHALFLTSYGEAFNPDVLSRMVTQFIKKADIDRTGSCHLIRHTCATQMHDNGADIRFIQQLLGHEKLETTAIYTEVSINQLREVHARTHPAESPKSPKPPQEEAPES